MHLSLRQRALQAAVQTWLMLRLRLLLNETANHRGLSRFIAAVDSDPIRVRCRLLFLRNFVSVSEAKKLQQDQHTHCVVVHRRRRRCRPSRCHYHAHRYSTMVGNEKTMRNKCQIFHFTIRFEKYVTVVFFLCLFMCIPADVIVRLLYTWLQSAAATAATLPRKT